ncbi:hypothetical protein HaLaN_03239, partial [Haematococcus lacustris]
MAQEFLLNPHPCAGQDIEPC